MTSSDLIFEMDWDFSFMYVSGSVEKAIGRKPSEMIGKKYSDFLETEEYKRFKQLVSRAIQTCSIIDTVNHSSIGE